MDKQYACNRCNHIVAKETELDYPWMCLYCDENMYSFEVHEANIIDPTTNQPIKETI